MNKYKNPDFWPTPKNMIRKMYRKLDIKRCRSILEPSAGDGAILDYIAEEHRHSGYDRFTISCIEKDKELQNVLKGKKKNLIDTDFLHYSGLDRFDTIIMNPPFSCGEDHLLKAIDLIFSGQIVCLLNAETLKNPYSNQRKRLLKILTDLNADIEYIKNGFLDAERRTAVEIALIYISIERDIDQQIFEGCDELLKERKIELEQSKELAKSNPVEFQISSYEAEIKNGLALIKQFYQYSGGFLWFRQEEGETSGMSRIDKVNNSVTAYVRRVRKYYWDRILELPEVRGRLTEKLRAEFNEKVAQQSLMEFSFNNVKQFIINLIGNYENILNDAVEEVFEKMTHQFAWSEECGGNIHYFDGWKTNKAFYVNKKVIIPIFPRDVFVGYSGEWSFSPYQCRFLDDIDKVMSYFDGRREYLSIIDAVTDAFKSEQTRNIESTYFIISCYKKGTIHLTFRNKDILRRFNIVGCQGRNWLPPEYSKKVYSDLTQEEKLVVEAFEGIKSYTRNLLAVGYSKEAASANLIGMST